MPAIQVYRDDDTILSWDLINEPRCERIGCDVDMLAWIEEMAPYVKALDGNHLLTVGVLAPSANPDMACAESGVCQGTPKRWMESSCSLTACGTAAALAFNVYSAWDEAGPMPNAGIRRSMSSQAEAVFKQGLPMLQWLKVEEMCQGQPHGCTFSQRILPQAWMGLVSGGPASLRAASPVAKAPEQTCLVILCQARCNVKRRAVLKQEGFCCCGNCFQI